MESRRARQRVPRRRRRRFSVRLRRRPHRRRPFSVRHRRLHRRRPRCSDRLRHHRRRHPRFSARLRRLRRRHHPFSGRLPRRRHRPGCSTRLRRLHRWLHPRVRRRRRLRRRVLLRVRHRQRCRLRVQAPNSHPRRARQQRLRRPRLLLAVVRRWRRRAGRGDRLPVRVDPPASRDVPAGRLWAERRRLARQPQRHLRPLEAPLRRMPSRVRPIRRHLPVQVDPPVSRGVPAGRLRAERRRLARQPQRCLRPPGVPLRRIPSKVRLILHRPPA